MSLQLQLSDVNVGIVKNPTRWSNPDQKYLDLNPLDVFIDSFKSPNLEYREGNIPEGQAYHKNYMTYLKKCWAEHLGIVVTPDILWYTLLCEIAGITKANPEQYRSLFTTSDEKQEIVIMSGSLVVMPLSTLIEALKDYVPTDTDQFLPEFTTSTLRSKHAFRAAFCDMCSPYYNYSMMLCGFPVIDVRGTEEDYNLMTEKWRGLSKLFNNHTKWFTEVQEILDNCFLKMNDASWWREMFILEKCGSGGDVDISGWFTKLFLEQPRPRYPENFSSCVSIVDYKQLETDKNYRMQDGLFISKMEGDFLVPDFGFVVHERIE